MLATSTGSGNGSSAERAPNGAPIERDENEREPKRAKCMSAADAHAPLAAPQPQPVAPPAGVAQDGPAELDLVPPAELMDEEVKALGEEV